MKAEKKTTRTNERRAYGLTILKASHEKVRQLKRDHEPSIHGNKFWTSSYLLMAYLEHQGLPPRVRVMEVGCGWGLAGIFCAKYCQAAVTGVDADAQVFPYLHLHAELNGVQVETFESRFEDLGSQLLSSQDVLLGADICFWDEMVEPLYRLIENAVDAGVQQVIVSDPGRPPFERVCQRSVARLGAETKEWDISKPVRASGTLLIVGSLPTGPRGEAP